MPEIRGSQAGPLTGRHSQPPTCVIAGSADQLGQAQEPSAQCISIGERKKNSETALSELLSNSMNYAISSGSDQLKSAEQRD